MTVFLGLPRACAPRNDGIDLAGLWIPVFTGMTKERGGDDRIGNDGNTNNVILAHAGIQLTIGIMRCFNRRWTVVHTGMTKNMLGMTVSMVPDVGFELTTYRLQGGCSTTELIRHI